MGFRMNYCKASSGNGETFNGEALPSLATKVFTGMNFTLKHMRAKKHEKSNTWTRVRSFTSASLIMRLLWKLPWVCALNVSSSGGGRSRKRRFLAMSRVVQTASGGFGIRSFMFLLQTAASKHAFHLLLLLLLLTLLLLLPLLLSLLLAPVFSLW